MVASSRSSARRTDCYSMTVGDTPTLTVIAGPNGAGKSTLVKAMQADGFHFGPFVNADVIASQLPAGTPSPTVRAGRLAVEEAQNHIAAGRSFAQETTLTGRFAQNLMEKAKAAGFRVNMVYVSVATLSIAKRRVAGRVAQGGHDIPSADQERRFARSRENIEAAAKVADNVVLLDNTRPERAYHLAVDIERGTVRHLDREAPGWSRKAVAQLPQEPNPSRQLSDFGGRIAEGASNALGSMIRQADQAQPGRDQAGMSKEIAERIEARMRQLDSRSAAATRSRGGPER